MYCFRFVIYLNILILYFKFGSLHFTCLYLYLLFCIYEDRVTWKHMILL